MLRSLTVALLLLPIANSQSTSPSPGLTLISPNGMSTTDSYLVDSNMQVTHQWATSTVPGNSSYLDRDGNLLKPVRTGASPLPGSGGGIQRIAYDGTVLWDYVHTQGVGHHDIEELPNGNVLLIVAQEIPAASIIGLGRDPALVTTATWVTDTVVELQQTGPTTAAIVWEWRAIDHLVQDFLPAGPDFDVVADRPERIDANYPPTLPTAYWFHFNGVDYNPELDQIAISARNWSEMWIIDHSTTTAEAAGSTGGNSGKGGDLLYRWGNPAAYGAPGPQQLSLQHDVNWVEPGRPGAGNLICFNNEKGSLVGMANSSAVTEIIPPIDVNGNYPLTPGSAWGPAAPVWEYTDPTPTNFYSPILSSAQRLQNGNTLISSAVQERIFEVGLNDAIVWEANTYPRTFKVRRYESALFPQAKELSVQAGGSIALHMHAGSDNAGRFYLMLGSTNGTTPGFNIQGFNVPINPNDFYFDWTVRLQGAPLASNFGVLDALGRATATYSLPPGTAAVWAGTIVQHAYGVFQNGSVYLVSEARSLELLP